MLFYECHDSPFRRDLNSNQLMGNSHRMQIGRLLSRLALGSPAKLVATLDIAQPTLANRFVVSAKNTKSNNHFACLSNQQEIVDPVF